MSAARTNVPGVVITDWKDHKAPRVNGKALALDREEYARCVDIAPDGRTIVLGGEWSVRAYDRNARPLWVRPVAQVVWGVAISGDGRSVVAALSDGTLRWYRMEDGQEYFALFAHRDGQWIAWVPQGYYYSSEQGDNFVGWHLNRTPDAAADFYRAVQFERVLYRYDLVSAQLANRAAGAHAPAGRFDIAQLAKIAPAPRRARSGLGRGRWRELTIADRLLGGRRDPADARLHRVREQYPGDPEQGANPCSRGEVRVQSNGDRGRAEQGSHRARRGLERNLARVCRAARRHTAGRRDVSGGAWQSLPACSRRQRLSVPAAPHGSCAMPPRTRSRLHDSSSARRAPGSTKCT